jgi:CRP-like cAMP-binding protein
VPQSENLILNALPQNVYAAIERNLKPIVLTFGDVVAEPGEPVQKVYFPNSGVISLRVEMATGEMIETAMVGHDGGVNASAALDGNISLHKSIVQAAGTASAIMPDELKSLCNEFEPLRSALLHHEYVLFAEVQQSAACNASHKIDARLCRWLLRLRDLTGSEDIQLTQEYLAEMLGVRRTSVSVIAENLQKAGLIKYRRGHIRLMEIKRLEQAACECYGRVKRHYRHLLSS